MVQDQSVCLLLDRCKSSLGLSVKQRWDMTSVAEHTHLFMYSFNTHDPVTAMCQALS